MDKMTQDEMTQDPRTRLPHGQLPPIPDGCGILPIAENRIVRGAHSELLAVLPEGVHPLAGVPGVAAPVLQDAPESDSPENDGLEQRSRQVLARAFGLAAGAMLVTATVAASLVSHRVEAQNPAAGLLAGQLLVRVVVVSQVLILGLCSRYVEKLGMATAAVLLFSYAALSGLEFSVLVSPAALATAFFCAGSMYGAAALWGLVRGSDLARPVTPLFMILSGGAILAAVNHGLGSPRLTWSISAIAVVVFAWVAGSHAQQVRDLYQEFDDDNAEGWKASVVGALLLLLNLVNLYLLVGAVMGNIFDDSENRSGGVDPS
jgi:FtsH-binding integral membrane protein